MKKRVPLLAGLLPFYLIPLILIIVQIALGTFPFWYDNARDLLQAMTKPTLIGPTTGIPGIFYGPYWIWLLNLALLISKDPRVVNFFVATVPYFIFLPFLLFKLKKVFHLHTLLIVWLLFITSFATYTMQLWNPYPAPLLFIALVTIITLTDLKKLHKKNLLQILAAGFVAGHVANFHLSFGIGVLAGSISFFLIRLFRYFSKNNIIFLLTFIVGILFAFAPFILFEIKHGFHQIQTIITVATSRELLVQRTGLSNPQIIEGLFTVFGKLFGVSSVVGYAIGITIFVSLLLIIKQHKKSFTDQEKRFLFFTGSIFVTLFALYLTARYPVWSYHFIGTEMLILLFILFVPNRSKFLTKVVIVWLIILLPMSFFQSTKNILEVQKNPYTETWVATQEHINHWIAKDAGDKPYDIYVYSPSMHTYEYDYLAQLLLNRPLHTDEQTDASTVYLIIPQTTTSIREDFINYRSSPERYQTTREYVLPDGTTILKRKHKKIMIKSSNESTRSTNG